MKLLILIPAHNETETLASVIQEVKRYGQWPILVMDDASTDETIKVAKQSGAMVLPLRIQLGAWGATQAGFRFAVKHGYQSVVTLDADGQHEPKHIQSLLDPLKQGNDVVIGAFIERGSRARNFAWHYFRTITGLGIEDLTSGFRAYGHRALKALAGPEATLLDYQDLGVLLLCREAGFHIKEVPTPMQERTTGASRVFKSWFVVCKYMAQTTVICLARMSRLKTKSI